MHTRLAAALTLSTICTAVLLAPTASGDPAVTAPRVHDQVGESADLRGGTAATIEPLSNRMIATGLTRPVAAVAAPGDPNRLYIAEQFVGGGGTARVRILNLITEEIQPTASAFLTITGISPTSGASSTGGDERGLLGLAFHPNYAENGYVYVNYTNSAGATVIRRFTRSVENPDQVDPLSGFTIMTISQPFTNHNAGWMDFGPDGYLYIAMGDGGSGGDPGNRGQNLGVLLGKMLRIDVDGGSPYAVPPSNPFISNPGALNEIWSYGLRNPFRNSFDRGTGNMFIADVGQNAWEEISFESASSPGGVNYGWRCYEGNAQYNLTGCPPANTMKFPFYTVSTGSNASVIGGYVYRGFAIPSLVGTYFWGGYFPVQIWSATVTPSGNSEIVTDLTSRSAALGASNASRISSFGEDAYGEVYVVGLHAGAANSGRIWKVMPFRPVNNECSGALEVGEGQRLISNHATTNTGYVEEACMYEGEGAIQSDIWFKHTAACAGELTVSLCGSGYWAKLGVYSGCPTAPGQVLACDVDSCPDGMPTVTIPVAAGELILIRVGGVLGAVGNALLDVSCKAGVACPGDFDGSGSVDVFDLLQLLGAWGDCAGCVEDIDGNGAVDVFDLLALLGAWGTCGS
jgi:glucose/arabinose dehydrogenase